ncbi:MAG: amidohydrolase family protein [Chitinophagales bacterium]
MKSVFYFLSFVMVVACNAQEPIDSRQREIVIRSVNVIPMDKERVMENQDVLIRNGKISAIENSGTLRYTADALIVEGKGKYLMPGLAEMHAHVPQGDNLEPMKEVLKLFIVNGVTTIRGMLGHPKHLELRAKLKSREIIGPHFYTSGPSFNGNSVKTPEAGAEMVKQQKQAGYDFLKLHPGLNVEKFEAISKTAKEVNIPFAGHVSFDVRIGRAIDAGYATIDHLDGFIESLVPGIESIKEQEAGPFALFIADKADHSKISSLAKSLRDHNIWVVPTQALAERWFASNRSSEQLSKAPEMKYMDASTAKAWLNNKNNLQQNPQYDSAAASRFVQLRRKLIYECNKAGVGLLLGSDAPQVFNVPGFSIHHELQYMVDAGLTPYEALKTGTVNVAKFYGQNDQGTIRKDSRSDLILLNGNPLKDISQTRNISGVMLGNLWLSKEYIVKELEKIEKQKAF